MATAKKATPGTTTAKESSASRSTGSSTTRSKASNGDAISLLMKDHADVKKLFKTYEKLAKAGADESEREAMALQICGMLTVHATIEEEIFYPAMREASQEDDLLDEAEVEHASAKDMIAQIEGMHAGDDLYDAKVKVLGEYIDHHVQEEEGEMFPKAKRAKLDLASLAEQLQERKDTLVQTESH